MLLAIDAGNTNIVFAVFDGETLVKEWRLSTDSRRTADEYALFLLQLMTLEHINKAVVTEAIISTVVPGVLFALRTLCRQYFNCEALIVGAADIKLGVQVIVERPSEVGADRLVNSIAAYKKFGGNTIIIDFGTATTFDVINKQGDYIGGVIAPGINLSLDALHKAAAKLPNIAIERPASIIGKSTISAMQSGIYFGYVGLIEGILHRIQEQYGEPMKTVATGGLASLFYKEMKEIEYLERDLTMIGLQIIYQRNSGKN
jgi:type III pantothenate kinase